MTTIDHQQAAVLAGAEALWKADPTCFGVPAPKTSDEGAYETIGYTEDSRAVITAATPHLRAAWEQEMAEKIRAKFLGPDFGRNPVNGQDSPDAALHAAYDEGLQTALALLEGGTD